MNKKTTYETLIAEKLEQLPVPDMADAIWAKIELELDTTSGTDGADDQMPSPETLPANVMTAAKMWGIIITVVAIAVLVLLFTKNNRKKNPVEEKKATPVLQEAGKKQEADTPGSIIPARPVFNTPVISPALQPKPVDAVPVVISPVINDPVSNEPFKNDPNDPPVSIINSPILGRTDSAAMMPPIKKSRGVKNISDADYKIVSSKKDSVKN